MPRFSPPALPGPLTVVRQLYKDWFGKDVQETPTVSYVWTADQFGHFGLGFTITYLFSWIARWVYGDAGVPEWAFLACGGANFLLWLVKEVLDYFRELKNYNAAHVRNGQPIPGVAQFPFNSREIWWNVITALIYFATGIIVATAALYNPLWAIVATGLVFVMTLGVGYWWVRRKIVFQQAGLPYLYRVANFPNRIDVIGGTAAADAVAVLERFCTPQPDAHTDPTEHLILTGPAGAGKSSLAAATGTEHAFQMGIGRYITLAKLLEFEEARQVRGAVVQSKAYQGGTLTNPRDQEFFDGRILWPWDRSPLLIIDDVDDAFGLDSPGAAADPDRGLRVIESIRQKIPGVLERVQEIPRVIWVISNRLEADAYRRMLLKLFPVEPGTVHIIQVTPI